MGFAFGCIICPSFIESVGSTVRVQWLTCLSLFMASSVMLSFIADAEVNIVLTCICQMIMGASLMIAMLANLKHIG